MLPVRAHEDGIRYITEEMFEDTWELIYHVQ